MKYITIGKLEIYFIPFSFDMFIGSCRCKFLELGYFGFTWLSKDYSKPL